MLSKLFSLTLALATLCTPCHAIIKLRCRQERCGLFGVVMHSGEANTNACTEKCIMFPLLALRFACGGCGTVGAPSPPVAPSAFPPPSPTPPSPAPPTGTDPSPTVTPNPNSNYTINFDLVGIPTSDMGIFDNAAARWSTVILNDLAEINTTLLNRVPGCTYPTIVDDLFICGEYKFIDGPSRVLASAGPYYWRVQGGLPIIGTMQFDTSDIASMKRDGSFIETIVHEMGHVIGIGTRWEELGVTGPDLANCPYRGINANREYQLVSGCTVVPTEEDGGPGTACGHFDEECLRHEMMTGYITPGSPGILSKITVGTLEDLGYRVDYSRAEAYSSFNLGFGCTCRIRRRTMMDMYHGETFPLGVQKTSQAAQSPPRRRLSEEAHELALETGRAILKQRAQSHSKASKSMEEALNVKFVGDLIVSVVVQDGDQVHGVIVRKGD